MSRETDRQGLFWRWGRFVHRFRWLVVALSVALFISFGMFARQLPDLLKDNGFAPRGSESDTGFALLEDELGYAASSLMLVYTSESRDLTLPAELDAIMSSLENLRSLPYVQQIAVNETPRTYFHPRLQSVRVELDLPQAEALDRYPEIRNAIRAPYGMKVQVDGAIATLYDIQRATKKDLAKSEMLGLPVALLVLLLIFGSVWAAMLPLAAGVMSVAVTLGASYFIAQQVQLSNFLPNMVTMIGLAIGIDYALFVVSRFREESARHPAVGDAVAATCATAGRSIFFSGIAVLAGLLGMLFIDLPVMRALCLGGVMVVLASVAVSNTLLPALLGILGNKVNRFSFLPALQKRRQRSTLWEKIAYAVMKRPALLAVLMSGMLILLMLPIGGIKLGVPTAEVLPPVYESRQGSDLLKKAYDVREANPIQVVVRADGPIWEVPAIEQVRLYSSRIEAVNGVRQVNSYLTAAGGDTLAETATLLANGEIRTRMERNRLARGSYAVIDVVPDSDPESEATANVIRKIRDLDAGTLGAYITGFSANRIDIIERIDSGMPGMIAFVMAVTYAVLFAAFRSVLLPLKAVLMNVLSLGASLGIVVVVFQRGWLSGLLHITSVGYVSVILPVTIFCVVFGISMDYEVFLISRIKEEYKRTGDNEVSTAVGLTKTGGLITSAALILIVVVGSFIFTDIEITKALGVGLFSAIFIDATLIRVIVVPALMKLMGRLNWWAPAWSR